MKKIKKNTRKNARIAFTGIFIMLISISFIMLTVMDENNISQANYYEENFNDKPQTSVLIGFINHTNFQVNNTEFTHNDTMLIQGKIYLIPAGPGVAGLDVAVTVNDVFDYNFNDTTDANGNFSILYTIPNSLDVYTSHKIQVNITSDTGSDDYAHRNYFNIDVNSTSKFKVDWLNSDYINDPLMPGETYHLEGNLEMKSGIGIPSKQIFRNWSNEISNWGNGSFYTIVFGGLPTPAEDIDIPLNITTDNCTMRWNYASAAGLYENSNFTLFFKVFRNVTVIWNIVDNTSEGEGLIIRGRIVSLTNQSMGISGRDITIYYDGNPIFTPTTDSNGNFSVIYQVPTGLGLRPIQIGIYDALNNWTIVSETEHNVTVSAAPAQTGDVPPTAPPVAPFGDLLIILIPIIASVGGVLAVLGYLFLKKQEEDSMTVSVPLERRIKNLKILKDTGRLEEALSYLFNAVYMDLINAKFARTKKVSETIRDFAIVSVKELKMNPATIYPFIQKVEEIIYARPYSITERDFYDACGLFSPVYFQLTGRNFVLNF